MNDDTHNVGGDEPMPTWCNPIRAKSMEGIAAEVIRNLLDHRCHEDLMELYGIRPDEAAVSLHFADLASLPAWDVEVLAEVAGVAPESELAELRERLAGAKRDVERQMWSSQLANREEADRRLTRRLRLAMLSEQLPEVMSPAVGVLFLRRVGIEVHYELLEAVATITLRACTDEAVGLYRELLRLPGPASQEGSEDAVISAEQVANKVDATSVKPKRPPQNQRWQEDEILRVISEIGLTATAVPKPPPGKSGVKAQVRRQLSMTKRVFELAWERLRADGRIADATLPQDTLPQIEGTREGCGEG